MKHSIIALIIVSVLISTATANDFTINAGSDIKSSYVAPSGIMAIDKPVIQSWVTVTHKSGIYFEPWHSESAHRLSDKRTIVRRNEIIDRREEQRK